MSTYYVCKGSTMRRKVRICRDCGQEIYSERGTNMVDRERLDRYGNLWVCWKSGDDGGTYDYCPGSRSGKHFPKSPIYYSCEW